MRPASDERQLIIPDLHDFQLIELSVGLGTARASFQFEGDVVHISVMGPSLVHFVGDVRTMYVADATYCTVENTSDLDALNLSAQEAESINMALDGSALGRQDFLKIAGLAGLDLILMGRSLEFHRQSVPYEPPTFTLEEQARSRALHSMLTGIVEKHGREALADPKAVGAEHRKSHGGRR